MRNKVVGIYAIPDINSHKRPFLIHDHSIAILNNGVVEDYIQQERLTGIKYDSSLQQNIVDLLREKGLFKNDVEFVFTDHFVGSFFLSTDGKFRSQAVYNSLTPSIIKGNGFLFDKNINVWYISHELAHIGSCLPFYGEFKEKSLLIHFDGGATLSNFSAWFFDGNDLKIVEYGWDLKWLTNLFNANPLTFGVVGAKREDQNSVPGKFMGFASYGDYFEEIEEWLKDNDFFSNCWGKNQYILNEINSRFATNLSYFDQRSKVLQNIAATIQEVFNKKLISKLEKLKMDTGAQYVYYSGGCALSIVANAQIVNSGLFQDVYIPPNCNDSGLSMGAACMFEWLNGYKIQIHKPFLNDWTLDETDIKYSDLDIEKIANVLIKDGVVGICNGKGEAGPRALGNRSLIALANQKSLAKKVSMEIKKREWYRPIAPVMKKSSVERLVDNQPIPEISKYMLHEFVIPSNKRDKYSGVIHVDGTARIQVLFNRNDNEFVWDLITFLETHHKVDALINTSFNVQGKPIVHSKRDAFESAAEMKLDALVFNGRVFFPQDYS